MLSVEGGNPAACACEGQWQGRRRSGAHSIRAICVNDIGKKLRGRLLTIHARSRCMWMLSTWMLGRIIAAVSMRMLMLISASEAHLCWRQSNLCSWNSFCRCSRYTSSSIKHVPGGIPSFQQLYLYCRWLGIWFHVSLLRVNMSLTQFSKCLQVAKSGRKELTVLCELNCLADRLETAPESPL